MNDIGGILPGSAARPGGGNLVRMATPFEWPEDRWEPCEVSVSLLSGPERIYDDEAIEHRPRRAGFGVVPEPTEPLLWDGDQA